MPLAANQRTFSSPFSFYSPSSDFTLPVKSSVRRSYRRAMRCLVLKPGSAARLSAGLMYVALLAYAVGAAFSQDPVLRTRTKEEREELVDLSHRIVLNVQVTDSSGVPAADLSAADFKLYDNNHARKIVGFHAIDGQALSDATETEVVLDAVNSPEPMLQAERSAIFSFLTQSRKPFPNPTAFALWSNGHLSATEATTDRNQIGRAFVKMTKGLQSNDCSDERNLDPSKGAAKKVSVNSADGRVDFATCRAVHFRDSIAALDSLAQKQSTGGGRTLLIWVGPGWPRLSREEIQRISPTQQQSLAQEYVMLLHDFRAAQMTVYSVAPANPAQSGAFGEQESPAVDVSDLPGRPLEKLALPEFAHRTGGRAIAASTDLTADLKSCMHDADWYYAVTFNAPPAQNGAGELHSLAVRVDRPGLQVRTMDSYYPEP